MDFLNAALLGVLEGLTEFLPVSSTGHLILAGELIHFNGPPGNIFEIIIQLGAILAIVWLYRAKFWQVAKELPTSREARYFARNIAIAFLPAMVIGFFAHDVIKSVLFDPVVVAWALILGGIAILVIEKKKPVAEVHSTEQMSARTALLIGFYQCVAMIPGVSRSGATIMGALLARVDRVAAAEFSFFLAVPTMFAATLYDLYKNWDGLTGDGMEIIAVGFVTAFVSAMVVVKWLVRFVQTNDFVPFAYYRMLVGVLMLAVFSF